MADQKPKRVRPDPPYNPVKSSPGVAIWYQKKKSKVFWCCIADCPKETNMGRSVDNGTSAMCSKHYWNSKSTTIRNRNRERLYECLNCKKSKVKRSLHGTEETDFYCKKCFKRLAFKIKKGFVISKC